MPHTLQQEIRSIARRAQWLMFAYGAAWVVTLVVAAGFLLGLGDYLIRYQELGLRVLGSVGLLFVLAASCYWFLLPALRFRRDDIEIAQQIERRFPELNGRLSSALAFLRQDEHDPLAGSAELRRAVVAEASAVLQRVRMSDALDGKISFRVVLMAVIACEIVAGVCWFDVSGAAVAAERLAAPWTAKSWPKRNNLQFVNAPTKVAAGSDVSFELIDANGRLPQAVTFQYRWTGDDRVRERPMKRLDGQMVTQLQNAAHSFHFRAIGGDDETVWRTVHVRQPPSVTEFEVRLIPPAYTRQRPETTTGYIRALQGTQIEITGTCDEPLQSARMAFQHGDGVEHIPVRLGADQKHFYVPADASNPWTVEKSGSYWLELVDQEDLKSGENRRWQIRAVADRPPNVVLEKPDTNLFVTADAIVSIHGTVTDDLAIRAIEVRYVPRHKNQGDDQPGEEGSIQLFNSTTPETAPDDALRRQEDRQLVRHEIDLSQVSGLEPGDYLDLRVAAGDFKPQEGESPARRLTIISPQELEERIGQRQTYILGQLGEVLAVQREARSQTRSLQTQLAEVGRFNKQDIDQMQSAELTQRQVRRLLIEDDNSAANQIAQLLRDLEANRVDSPDVKRRMDDLLAEIRRIDSEHLTAVQQGLINALKIAREELQDTGAVGGSVGDPLQRAGDHQDQVIASLENILGELSEWDNYHRFAREISRLRRQQQEIGGRLDELPSSMLSKDVGDLNSQEKADLKKLSVRQMELARQFDTIGARMRQMQARLQTSEPLIAETIADALDAAARIALGGQMRESGRNIEQNRIGRAAEIQEDITQGLQQLLDILANRRESELDRIVEQLVEVAAELAELRERAEMLREAAEAAASQSDAEQRRQQLDRLSDEQQQLAEELQRLTRRLQRLQTEQPAEAIEQAIQRLQRARAAAQEGDAGAAADESEETARLLDEAQRQLEQAIRQAEQQLFQEQVERLQQKIEGLVRRQEHLVSQTAELDGLRDQDGNLTREQSNSVLNLSRAQLGMAEETNSLADGVAQSEAFGLALSGASREMFRAAARLGRLDTSGETIRIQRAALIRLQQLIEALQPLEGEGAAEQPDPGQESELLPGEAVRLLAELRLVKMLQEQVHQRTAELQRAKIAAGGTLNDDQVQELAELVQEQGRLADLLFKLSEPPAENPEDDPASLPDVLENDKL